MGKRKFDDDQITGIQADVTVADVCHKQGISEQTSIGGNRCGPETPARCERTKSPGGREPCRIHAFGGNSERDAGEDKERGASF